MRPKPVSVIVPTYNRAYVLPRAVESALRQTHRAVEVIVVDDGSTDGTPELVTSRWGGDARVRYVRQQNAGVAAARNRGIGLARGEHVAFLDSDDEWLPWKLELQLAALEAFPDAGMIWTDMAGIAPDGTTIEPRYLRRMYYAWSHFACDEIFADSVTVGAIAPRLAERGVEDARIWAGDIFSPMFSGNLVHTSTVLLRRERLEQVGGFDERLRPAGEDYDYHLRTCRAGPVAFADLATIHYQRGMPDRLTRPENRIYLAQSFLATVTRTLQQDGERLQLPRARVRDVLAEAHSWVGEAALERGEHGRACYHLAASLRYRPANPDTLMRLAASLLPTPWLNAVRKLRAQARRAEVRP